MPFWLTRKLADCVSVHYARHAGMLLYASGRAAQPTPSELLHRRMRRD